MLLKLPQYSLLQLETKNVLQLFHQQVYHLLPAAPSQALLCADPLQLEASCSKSERAVKPACPRGQPARLPLRHIICVESLL